MSHDQGNIVSEMNTRNIENRILSNPEEEGSRNTQWSPQDEFAITAQPTMEELDISIQAAREEYSAVIKDSIINHIAISIESSCKRSERKKQILETFYGVTTTEYLSLSAIGEMYDISREAVRQTVKEFQQHCITPQERQIILEKIESLQESFPLYSLIPGQLELPQLIYRVYKYYVGLPKLKEKKLGKNLYVVSDTEIDYSQVASQCVKSISHLGAVDLSKVSLSHFNSESTHHKELLIALISLKGDRPTIIKADGNEYAFHQSKGRNRILARLAKIFYVYKSIEVVYLRRLILRDLMRKDSGNVTLFADDVLISMAEIVFGARVVDDKIYCDQKPKLKTTIGSYEKKILDFLKSSSQQGVHERREKDIETVVKLTPGDAFGFSMALNHSSLIHRARRGVYILPGEVR